jgi:hypothetical protein
MGTDAVVGPWSMHVVEAAGSLKRPGILDYLALRTDGNFDLILEVKDLLLGVLWEKLQR